VQAVGNKDRGAQVTRDDLLGYLSHDNVTAFLRVIRQGESNQTEDAYTVLNGNIDHLHPPPWVHPERVGTGGTSTAAGAYQIIKGTWSGLVKQYGFEDFSPRSQDMAAVALIAGRRALEDVLRGDPNAAVRKLRDEWECFKNNQWLIAEAEAVFVKWGGSLARTSSKAPQPVPSPTPTTAPKAEVSFMAPIVLPILSALTSLIPQLGQLFGSGSEVANRNIAAGSILAQKITEVTNSVNLQEAAEKIQNSPEALQAAREAVAVTLPQLTETGGGIGKAREVAYSVDQVPYWKNPAFVIAAFLSPLIYMVAVEILFNPSKQNWSDDIKMMFVTAIVSGLLGSITGFFLGSSLSTGGKRATDK
jgi:muramidase (phage lysozyme)